MFKPMDGYHWVVHVMVVVQYMIFIYGDVIVLVFILFWLVLMVLGY
jgi:hypothetical protein